MPRIMTNPTPVKIVSDELNCYATIQRSMIGAITALIRIQGKKGKHTNSQLEKLREVKKWAEHQYDFCVDNCIDKAGNPALG